MSHVLDNHPFDLDDVVEFVRPAVFVEEDENGDTFAPETLEPTDFNDPYGVVEQIGSTRRGYNLTITMANQKSYYVTDLGAFSRTGEKGEAGLARLTNE